MGGLLETVLSVEDLEWFLMIPYYVTHHPDSLLGLSLTTVGLVLICLGIALHSLCKAEMLVDEGVAKGANHGRIDAYENKKD